MPGKKPQRPLPKYTHAAFDWKEAPELDDLNRCLNPFGVYAYEDPNCEGSDSYGFIFSDQPGLPKADLRRVAADAYGEDEDDGG